MNDNLDTLSVPAGHPAPPSPDACLSRLSSARIPAGRPFVERLAMIHLRLQDRSYPDVRRLAELSEVSERTIHRDLEFMKNRLNLPVIQDPVYQGYRYDFDRSLPSERAAVRALFGEVLQGLAAQPFTAAVLTAGTIDIHVTPDDRWSTLILPMAQTKDDLYSRPPLERMLGIHEQLQARRFPNCAKLARQFEVAIRTIMRDIEFMRCRFNLPIEYDETRYGYFYSDPVEQFPGVSVSESELFAIVIARKAVAQYQGTPFEKPLAAAYRKLAAGLGQDRSLHFENANQLIEFRPLGTDDIDPELFEILCRGTRLRRTPYALT